MQKVQMPVSVVVTVSIWWVPFHHASPKGYREPVASVTARNTLARLGLVAHPCNPSYWGGSDQEDHSLKPARAKG
jgi:hypothetical protein